jgi:ribosomal protein L21E
LGSLLCQIVKAALATKSSEKGQRRNERMLRGDMRAKMVANENFWLEEFKEGAMVAFSWSRMVKKGSKLQVEKLNPVVGIVSRGNLSWG